MAKRSRSDELERMYCGLTESRIAIIETLTRPLFAAISHMIVFKSSMTDIKRESMLVKEDWRVMTRHVRCKIQCNSYCNHQLDLVCESRFYGDSTGPIQLSENALFGEFGNSLQFWSSVVDASLDCMTFFSRRDIDKPHRIFDERFFSRLQDECWNKMCEPQLLKALDLMGTFLLNFVDVGVCDTRFLQLLMPSASIALELGPPGWRNVVMFNFVEQRRLTSEAQQEIRRKMGLVKPRVLVLELDAFVDKRSLTAVAVPALGAEFPDVKVLYLKNVIFSFVIAVADQFPTVEAILTVVRPLSHQDRDCIFLMTSWVSSHRRLRRFEIEPASIYEGHTPPDVHKLGLANHLFKTFLAERQSLNALLRADYNALSPLGNASRLKELKDTAKDTNNAAFRHLFSSDIFERQIFGIVARFVHGDTLWNTVVFEFQRVDEKLRNSFIVD